MTQEETQPNKPESPPPFKAGRVAIIGRANAGKSTLLNGFLNHKLSIVSPRPHTTRYRILGVTEDHHYQVGFIDTPGYLRFRRDWLDAAMRRQMEEALGAVDLVVLVVEPRPPGDVEQILMKELIWPDRPIILAVNKIDTVAKPKLLPVLAHYAEAQCFREMIPVSALYKDGLDLLLQAIVKNLPEGPRKFPPGTLTDRPEQFFISEIIREKVYLLFREEIPYQVAVTIEDFHEKTDDHPTLIEATIHVDRESQKMMVIGSKGEAVKKVGILARPDIEELLGQPIYLKLHVKRKYHWRKQTEFVKHELGYDEE